MVTNLKAFGKTLKTLRLTAGVSQQVLVERLDSIHSDGTPGLLPIDSQLISKWETAYTYKGRQWKPSRVHMLYLIDAFADYLTLEQAQSWAAQAGHKLIESDLATIFSPEPDWPPAQAPQLPAFHVRRQCLETAILDQIDNKAQSLVLWGPGGVGKTTLAVWITKLLATRLPDGVIWVSVQGDDSVTDIHNSIIEGLGLSLGPTSSTKQARKLHSRLQKKRCLLVLDDIAAIPNLADLRLGSETSLLICTTRDLKVADVLEAPLIKVTGLTNDEGLELLTKWAGYSVRTEALVTRLGGLPLALRLTGGQLRVGTPPDELLTGLHQNHIALNTLEMDDPSAQSESLTLCFDMSYRHLPPDVRQRFAQLGYFRGNNIEKAALKAVWDVNDSEAQATLKQLQRYALLERCGSQYRLHPLLHDYARQKLSSAQIDGQVTRQRHAIWYIRHVLYHPGILNNNPNNVPDLNQKWADIVAAIEWAVRYDVQLACWAALLAYTERPALLEEVGSPLIEAAETYLSKIADRVERVMLHELLGDLYLLRVDINAGKNHFQQASTHWQALENGLASSQAQLRVAGAHLMTQDQATAAKAARQAQVILQQSLPIAAAEKAQLDRLFYWFNMIYNPLVRWVDLPQEDLVSLCHIANQINDPSAKARSLHIYRLWCTTRVVPRSPEVRQQGRQLALEAYFLWQICGRKDRADDEISLTNYLLNNCYSRRTALRFARRRSRTTPQILDSTQLNFIQNDGIRWWLQATETQRVKWLGWMLPRYLGADNRPYHPAKKTMLTVLPSHSMAYSLVEDILNIGILGQASRRLSIKSRPPAEHILMGPEWCVLSGQRVLPLVENRTRELAKHYLT
jgi:hypothetical protein